MKRRKFLQNIGLTATAAPVMLNSIPVRAFANSAMVNGLDCTSLQERALVIIQLFGGNDGINTLVPLDQYDRYAELRPNIRIPDSGTGSYIELDPYMAVQDQVGLNPNMPEFKQMYDQGIMSVIQGVGYEDHNRSHFKSTDLIMTGGDGTFENFSFDTGWMGRYLDHTFPSAAGKPSPVMPDPLGIQLGNSESSLGFHIKGEFGTSINLSGQDLEGYYTLISSIGGAPLPMIPISEYGEELSYAMAVEESASAYSSRITNVFNKGRNALPYPDYSLANQLKTVARLIAGGSKTKIFLVYKTGFDTHGNQLVRQTNLLTELSQSVMAFQDDLRVMGLDHRVMTATVSEFGRKAFENGNYGTDHGTLNSMFVFGTGLKGGIHGTNLDLSVLDDGAPLNRQFDYRQVMTTLLQDWLGADNAALKAAKFDGFENQKLDLVRQNLVADASFLCPTESTFAGEVGYLKRIKQENKYQWHTVVLKRSYENPSVIMGPASHHGAQPLTVRVRNITSNSFQWQIDEWDYLDGAHIHLNISYMVVESGVYVLPNGTKLMAGVASEEVNQSWTSINFPQAFSKVPSVFIQCSSTNEESAVASRLNAISKTKFDIKLQEQESSNQQHAKENVCWIAIENGNIDSDSLKGEVGRTGNSVNHNDYTISFARTYTNNVPFFAAIQSFNGGDTSTLRFRNVTPTEATLFLEEEKSRDAEINHVRENVAYMVWGEGDGDANTNVIHASFVSLNQPEEVKESFHINCYPNPFVEAIKIEPASPSTEVMSVEITDIQGRVVLQKNGISATETLDLSGSLFTKGMYMVRAVSGEEVAVFKILKK